MPKKRRNEKYDSCARSADDRADAEHQMHVSQSHRDFAEDECP